MKVIGTILSLMLTASTVFAESQEQNVETITVTKTYSILTVDVETLNGYQDVLLKGRGAQLSGGIIATDRLGLAAMAGFEAEGPDAICISRYQRFVVEPGVTDLKKFIEKCL